MPNVTISFDEKLLKKARDYAKKHRLSLNALLKNLLLQELNSENQDWLEELFKRMDQAHANSEGKKWEREKLYER